MDYPAVPTLRHLGQSIERRDTGPWWHAGRVTTARRLHRGRGLGSRRGLVRHGRHGGHRGGGWLSVGHGGRRRLRGAGGPGDAEVLAVAVELGDGCLLVGARFPRGDGRVASRTVP